MTVFSHIKTPHGITDRHGGVSVGPYTSMNTSFYGHDDKNNVFENIRRALNTLEIDAKIIIATEQVHSDKILYVGKDFDFSTLHEFSLVGTVLEDYRLFIVRSTDGLMTDRDDVVLMTFYADCVPLLLYDAQSKLAASVHSGWKGTVQRIGERAFKMMVSLGANPKDISIGIGHSAGKCCYEVDIPVVEAFKRIFSPAELLQFIEPKADSRYMLDLKRANHMLLKNAGASDDQVEISPFCTICGVADYHSHRRTGYPRGSMSAFLQVK